MMKMLAPRVWIAVGAVSFLVLFQQACGIAAQSYGGSSGKWVLEGWNKEPGFEARITQSGLDFFKEIGLEAIRKKIKGFKIADIHGKAGHIDYSVTNIHITSFGIPSSGSSLTANPGAGGLTLSTKGVFFNVHGNFGYKIAIHHSGTFDASLKSISLRDNIRIGMDSTGRPQAHSDRSDCSFSVGQVNVKLHGGSAGMYEHKIEEELKSTLNAKTCKAVISAVNTDLENRLKKMKVVMPIKGVAEVDYSLVESPTFNGSVNTAHKGEVYPLGHEVECPVPIPQIAPDSDTSKMMFMWITDYLPNSAGYVIQNIGYLQHNVTPNNVPPRERQFLNTSNAYLDRFIPQLNKMYPDMAMQVNVNSTKAPMVKTTPSGIQAFLVGDFSSYAILPNKTLAYLFTLNVTITADLTVNSKDNNITWNVPSFSTKMETVLSLVGPINIAGIETLVNTAIANHLIPRINRRGAVGVPLPQVDGIDFKDPVITQHQGYLKIGTTLVENPSIVSN